MKNYAMSVQDTAVDTTEISFGHDFTGCARYVTFSPAKVKTAISTEVKVHLATRYSCHLLAVLSTSRELMV
jgi:hypothetical protein